MNDNKQVSLYDFKGHQVRVVELEGNPWFVAADVCRALGMSIAKGTSKYLGGLSSDERSIATRDNYPDIFGGDFAPTHTLVSEPGVYKIISRSHRPEARDFDRWVRHDVLPAIRKDGMYVKGEEKIDLADDDALDRMTKLVLEGR